MQEPSQKPWGLIIGAIIAASAIGGGLAWIVGQSKPAKTPIAEATKSSAPVPTSMPTTPAPAVTPKAPAPVIETTPGKTEVYWLQSKSTEAKLVAKVIQPSTNTPTEVQSLETALTQLLKGSEDPTLATTIPQGTTLLNLALKSDGIHIDLSKEFTSGGGAESMKGRLGQILYTATSLKTDAPVWLSVDGKPLEVLGGEGLTVDQPLTRKIFEKEYL